MKRALASSLLLGTLSGTALGAESETPEQAPDLVPYKRDAVGGHLQLGVTGTFLAPFGSLSETLRFGNTAGVGYGFVGDLGVGINRHVLIGAYGEYGVLSDTHGCPRCGATTFAAGIRSEYHLVQGLRFDPWASYGMGFRSVAVTAAEQENTYSGFEFMRLAFGANWMATPHFGLGPLLAFNGTRMIQVPPGESPHGSAWVFTLGLRFLLDFPGRRP